MVGELETLLRLDNLRDLRSCVLLGSAGLGKSHEMQRMLERDIAAGLDVRFERLALLGPTPGVLERKLGQLASQATEKTCLYLDALDEVMVPVQHAALILERWIRDHLESTRPRLRISCRSAIWPSSIESALATVYGKDSSRVAILQPLSPDDVRTAAKARGLDQREFCNSLDSTGAWTLATQPLTLEMLLRIFAESRKLPSRRNELFERGMLQLVKERDERRKASTVPRRNVGELLDAAERLATYTLLAGRETIDLREFPDSAALSAIDLSNLRPQAMSIEDTDLRALRDSGLCEGRDDDSFHFAHRQFAEYLAGRRLAQLPLHQARALLAGGLGWQSGVAGPLREVAAFAAMESGEVADWLARCDPEVIGQSDVADDNLRGDATRFLFEKFRRHELTFAQLGRDGIRLEGFQYDKPEKDLRRILRLRQADAEDLLLCAVKMCLTWKLESMSEPLASLILDASAPEHARRSAGRTLIEIGTTRSKRRLKPLFAAAGNELSIDLKGLALHCNWPQSIEIPELLKTITSADPHRAHGWFGTFLGELDRGGFAADGHRLAGLRWAQTMLRAGEDWGPIPRIVKRIAQAALNEVDQPGIANELARLLLLAASQHIESPLIPARSPGEVRHVLPRSVLPASVAHRRALADAITASATDELHVSAIAHQAVWVVGDDDFPWLIERAINPSLPLVRRKFYLRLAQWLNWDECTPAWFAARHIEPVATILKRSTFIELGSDEAILAQRMHAEAARWSGPPRKHMLSPPPVERIELALNHCESTDIRAFYDLLRQLTLKPDSSHYEFSRAVTAAPGWGQANPQTRRRIVEVAKRFLSDGANEVDQARTEPLSTVYLGVTAALFLLTEVELAWVDALPPAWWQQSAWYLIRELRPGWTGESDSVKRTIFARLCAHAPNQVRAISLDLSLSRATESHSLFTALLGLLEEFPDQQLDRSFCEQLEQGKVGEDRLGEVASFVLARTSSRGLQACLTRLRPATRASVPDGSVSDQVVKSAVSMLHTWRSECWQPVLELLQARPDLAARILADFSLGRILPESRQEKGGFEQLPRRATSQLFQALIRNFPPELDPPHGEGAYDMDSTRSAIHLRELVLNWLGDQKDLEAVEVLRDIERKFGSKYSWLRFPRSRAERAYRLARWTPVTPAHVAEVLGDRDKRLLRSGRDVLDGVEAAIELFERNLRTKHPADLESFWNRGPGKRLSPKEEQHVSDKLCEVVRTYFAAYAVGTTREPQLRRRLLGKSSGGAPGSNVDVLCCVLPKGTVIGEQIDVPIEVKRSQNREAKTELGPQLVDRYMAELGTDFGVFAVAWFGVNKAARVRAVWASKEKASADLKEQAARVSSDLQDVRAVLLNLAPSEARDTARRKPQRTAGASRPSQSKGIASRSRVGRQAKRRGPQSASRHHTRKEGRSKSSAVGRTGRRKGSARKA